MTWLPTLSRDLRRPMGERQPRRFHRTRWLNCHVGRTQIEPKTAVTAKVFVDHCATIICVDWYFFGTLVAICIRRWPTGQQQLQQR